MDDNGLILFYMIASSAFIFITARIIVTGKVEKWLAGSTIALFVLALIFNGLWFLSPSTTISDASRYLGNIARKGEVVIGPSAHVLAIDNKILPVRWSPYVVSTMGINKDLIQKKMYPKYLILNDDWYNAYLEGKDKGTLFGLPLGRKKVILIKKFPIVNFVFGGNWQTLILLELKGSR
jgi:hypothetical protein